MPLLSLRLDAEDQGDIQFALEFLQAWDERRMRKRPASSNVDPLRSGVVYRREQQGHEDWLSYEQIRRIGFADCEDLATWLAAYLNVTKNAGARAVCQPSRVGYHCLVKLPDGSTLDPSRELGMPGP